MCQAKTCLLKNGKNKICWYNEEKQQTEFKVCRIQCVEFNHSFKRSNWKQGKILRAFQFNGYFNYQQIYFLDFRQVKSVGISSLGEDSI